MEFSELRWKNGIPMGSRELPSIWNVLRVVTKAVEMSLYALVKCLHLLAVVVWLAGMFRLVHFFSDSGRADSSDMVDSVLDFDWNWTSPAMLLAWVLGSWMVWRVRWWMHSWFVVKFVLVLSVSALHGLLLGRAKRIAAGQNLAPKAYHRYLPALLLAVTLSIIVMVIAKPI